MNLNRYIKITIAIIVIFLNVGCDQFTKEKVRNEIADKEMVKIVDHHFTLIKVENTGAALGIFSNLPQVLKIILLQIFPLIVMLGLFWYIVKEAKMPIANLIGLSFIIGGGYWKYIRPYRP